MKKIKKLLIPIAFILSICATGMNMYGNQNVQVITKCKLSTMTSYSAPCGINNGKLRFTDRRGTTLAAFYRYTYVSASNGSNATSVSGGGVQLFNENQAAKTVDLTVDFTPNYGNTPTAQRTIHIADTTNQNSSVSYSYGISEMTLLYSVAQTVSESGDIVYTITFQVY